MTAPSRLKVEHLVEPGGVTVARPRFSWWLPAGSTEQTSYRLQVGNWDSGRVPDSRSVLVGYDGPELPAATQVPWRVKVWTDHGESPWSSSIFSTGLQEWTARWVSPIEDHPLPAAGTRPAYLLRGQLDVEGAVARATLYVTAHGVYEAFLNGARVGDLRLTPGSTAYAHRLQVQAFDVTSQVRRGANRLRVELADGWYRGVHPHSRKGDLFGAELALLAELRVEHPGGGVTVLGTGDGWESGRGQVDQGDLLLGERVDLRRADRDWRPARVVDLDTSRLLGSPAPPVRVVEALRPVAVTRVNARRQVVDLGQNINGWVRLLDLGAAGTEIALTHGEALDATGDVTLDHLVLNGADPGQRDVVISDGHSVYESRFATKGFRYVRVEGHPRQLTPDDVIGCVVHTDLHRTGSFTCSLEELNRLHDAAVWSFRGNACDIPTDCPTRERAGWTGDWQLYYETAAFLYDVAGFNDKWLRDMAAQQWDDGRMPQIVPDPGEAWRDDVPEMRTFAGSAGWGDAIVHNAYQQHRHYGDLGLAADLYPAMVRWVEFAERTAAEERHPSKTAPPRPHERYLWDHGFHWGEWLEPGENDGTLLQVFQQTIDFGAVSTAYLFRSSQQLSELAQLLGHKEDAERFAELSANVRDAWQREYLGTDGRATPDTQATYARALSFGLLPDDLVPAAVERLVALIRESGTHVGTGFLATPMLLPVLADHGQLDVAYELLLQRTEPSWLVMLDRGATTVWEAWNGLNDRGEAYVSLNHYSKGAVITFLHTRVAGIQLIEPGYRRFALRPQPGGGLTSAEAVLESPYGRIRSAWSTDDGFVLEATVPSGTTAEVTLPDGRTFQLPPGEHVLA